MSNPTSAIDRCPRCGGSFHCGFSDAEPCACGTLRLTVATLAELRERYAGCLCLACLHEVAESQVQQESAR